MKRVAKMKNVKITTVDACQYGMSGSQGGEEHPVWKPTKWMTNMDGVSQEMMKRCTGRNGECSRGGHHVSCTGERARRAAVYPLELCKALLRGIKRQLTADGVLSNDAIWGNGRT